MTRYEAHLEFDLIQNGNRGEFKNIEKHKYIDKIFDYFESQQKALTVQSTNSSKHRG